jgi:D-alanyl-D-alanine carboxypeptidase (penicillin-binding protein 5/6)
MRLEMQRIYRRRRVIVALIFGAFIALLVWIIASIGGCIASINEPNMIENSAPASFTAKGVDPNKPPIPQINMVCNSPEAGASVMGIGTYKRGLVANCGGDVPVSIASVTKTITSLVVLNHKPLEQIQAEEIVIDQDALADIDHSFANQGTTLDVVEGTRINKIQAIEGMMLESANNIADTLARQEFGSLANYRNEAQKYLTEHGLNNTILGGDASGLDDQTKSTPKDLFEIGKLVHDNPTLANIVNMQSAEFPGVYNNGMRTIGNGNHDLLSIGYSGIKIGYTIDAGYNLLFSKPLPDGDVIIGATLGDKNLAYGLSFPDAQKYTTELEGKLKGMEPVK